jgi:hypothetical protein
MPSEPSPLSVPELPSIPTLPATRSTAAPRPGTVACALCLNHVDAATICRIDGMPACRTCDAQIYKEVAATHSTPSLRLALILGAVGAAMGAAVWVAIAKAVQIEIGYVAVLVGFLAGLGVKLGADDSGSDGQQFLAVALAVAGLAGAKYWMVFGPLGDELSAFDILWVCLASSAAWRTSAP